MGTLNDLLEEAEKDRMEATEERKRMSRQWGELANKWGTIVEDIVNYLSRNKIYAMAMKDDIMDILNPDLKQKGKR